MISVHIACWIVDAAEYLKERCRPDDIVLGIVAWLTLTAALTWSTGSSWFIFFMVCPALPILVLGCYVAAFGVVAVRLFALWAWRAASSASGPKYPQCACLQVWGDSRTCPIHPHEEPRRYA